LDNALYPTFWADLFFNYCTTTTPFGHIIFCKHKHNTLLSLFFSNSHTVQTLFKVDWFHFFLLCSIKKPTEIKSSCSVPFISSISNQSFFDKIPPSLVKYDKINQQSSSTYLFILWCLFKDFESNFFYILKWTFWEFIWSSYQLLSF
jgi:hypothetical protein